MPSPIHRRSLATRQKQAVTLAGAIGILACGACFGPSNYKPPPPPPIQIDLRGIHTVRVEVTDISESHHIDTAALAKRTYQVLNAYSKDTGVAAVEQRKPANATLNITLLDVLVVPDTPPTGTDVRRWSIQLRYSASLTSHDGVVLWSKSDFTKKFSGTGNATEDAEAFWQRASASYPWINNTLGFQIVRQMYYEAPK